MTGTKARNGSGRQALLLAIVAAALPGCDGSRSPAPSSSNSSAVQEQGSTPSPRDQAPETAADPVFQGNEVVLHEYGDDRTHANVSPPVPATPKMMRGAEIRRAVAGHELTDGAHWSWTFGPGGRLSGDEDGQRSKSKWHIKGDELCIDVGYGDGCYTVHREGRFLQLWQNGVVGIEAELR